VLPRNPDVYCHPLLSVAVGNIYTMALGRAQLTELVTRGDSRRAIGVRAPPVSDRYCQDDIVSSEFPTIHVAPRRINRHTLRTPAPRRAAVVTNGLPHGRSEPAAPSIFINRVKSSSPHRCIGSLGLTSDRVGLPSGGNCRVVSRPLGRPHANGRTGESYWRPDCHVGVMSVGSTTTDLVPRTPSDICRGSWGVSRPGRIR